MEKNSIKDLVGFEIADKETPGYGETTMDEMEALAMNDGFNDLRVLEDKTIITMEYVSGRVNVWHDDKMIITSVTEG